MNSILILMAASLPPYLVTNEGTLNVETPEGQTIVVPEGSRFTVNRVRARLDVKEVTLDNIAIFKSGFES